MKNFILLIFLTLSTGLLAQLAQEKYTMLKPLSWDELQLYQLDDLRSEKELNLAANCPSTLKKLQENYTKKHSQFYSIHGTVYLWTEYLNEEGQTCIVKHDKADSISNDDNNINNPN